MKCYQEKLRVAGEKNVHRQRTERFATSSIRIWHVCGCPVDSVQRGKHPLVFQEGDTKPERALLALNLLLFC